VSTESGDFCAQDGKTVLAQPTSPPEPNKAVVDGFTFTSPTNYMSFDNIGANLYSKVGKRTSIRKCGGPRKEHVVVPLKDPFYSADWSKETYSFNVADLNTAPAEAYSRQFRCAATPESCTGAFAVQTEYQPLIVLPTDLQNLKPEWEAAGCNGDKVAYSMRIVALATPTPTAVPWMLMD
jgi:hypothetical protein